MFWNKKKLEDLDIIFDKLDSYGITKRMTDLYISTKEIPPIIENVGETILSLPRNNFVDLKQLKTMNIKQFITNSEAKINSFVNKIQGWVTTEEHSAEQAIINEINKAEVVLAHWKQQLEDLKNGKISPKESSDAKETIIQGLNNSNPSSDSIH